MINRKVTPATMKLNTGVEVKVYGHIMLKNMWEVYITVLPDEDGIGMAYVCGFEDELGSFSMEEYKPHILSEKYDFTTENFEDENFIAPAPGATWVN